MLPIFEAFIHFTNILHCVLELTKMSIQLMDTVVCNELPVFLLYLQMHFFTVFYGFELLVHSSIFISFCLLMCLCWHGNLTASSLPDGCNDNSLSCSASLHMC